MLHFSFADVKRAPPVPVSKQDYILTVLPESKAFLVRAEARQSNAYLSHRLPQNLAYREAQGASFENETAFCVGHKKGGLAPLHHDW